MFCVAGDKPSIEIFDDETLESIHKFVNCGKYECHRNKVFVSKFTPCNDNLIYTGGWDRTVKFWDIRTDE